MVEVLQHWLALMPRLPQVLLADRTMIYSWSGLWQARPCKPASDVNKKSASKALFY